MKLRVDPTTRDGEITISSKDLMNILKRYREDYVIEIIKDGHSYGMTFDRVDNEEGSIVFTLED